MQKVSTLVKVDIVDLSFELLEIIINILFKKLYERHVLDSLIFFLKIKEVFMIF